MEMNALIAPPPSAIFIDLPNVQNKTEEDGSRSVRRVSYHRLAEQLRADTARTLPLFAGAYSIAHGSSKQFEPWLINMRTQFQPHKFDIFFREAKDIDSLIINDIWRSVGLCLEQNIARNRGKKVVFPLVLNHVLVSGDGGYLRAYEALEETYGEDLDLHLTVYSWESDLHPNLAEKADVVRLLDHLPDLMKGVRKQEPTANIL